MSFYPNRERGKVPIKRVSVEEVREHNNEPSSCNFVRKLPSEEKAGGIVVRALNDPSVCRLELQALKHDFSDEFILGESTDSQSESFSRGKLSETSEQEEEEDRDLELL
ncbi:Hypothetical predicted protein [Prunus dulcis]|uniref:Uncharacterized protein n=1 Tax=Prunus dulcis TaxID=3755 RepID=A0A5E4GMW6_PRUDU|nr:Hypothetical predicted protein [Prunus dulcis]